MSATVTRTKHPVVLIHGVFGYGRKRPFWNRASGYWPEQALDEMDANYLILDIGALSSDQDRACEAFYQLCGGRVDYGEAHALQFGHDRFGETFEVPLHPNWSAKNPVHLLGHSFGATTAIELYQLICQDYFGVGSSHKWAQCPVFKSVFDCHMPQWEFVRSFWEIVSSKNRILMSPDVAVYDIMPARRLARNQSLRCTDKPFLVSVVTSSSSFSVRLFETVTAIAITLLAAASGIAWFVVEATEVAVACACATFAVSFWLLKRVFLPILESRMQRCARKLHEIFYCFDRSKWEPNDGVVNICSMRCPQYLSPSTVKNTIHSDSDTDASTASGSTPSIMLVSPPTRNLRLNRSGVLALPSRAGTTIAKRLACGVWHVHKVTSDHHRAGTNSDRTSPTLYRHVLHLIATEFDDRKPSTRRLH